MSDIDKLGRDAVLRTINEHKPEITARRGDWQQTYTGRQFYCLSPLPSDVCIEDIAHHLSLVCRFGGALREFYSVCQHSIHVSEYCSSEDALDGLLHDAAEAYVGDMVRPIKRSMPEYQEIEHGVHAAIAACFGISHVMPDSVRHADNVLLSTEARDLLPHGDAKWELGKRFQPLVTRIVPMTPMEAERAFLERFWSLAARMRCDGCGWAAVRRCGPRGQRDRLVCPDCFEFRVKVAA